MDRYIKTVLTVIAGCLLVLVGAQVDFPAKAYAEISAAGHSDTNGGLVTVTEQGEVYFYNAQADDFYICTGGQCKKVLDDRPEC